MKDYYKILGIDRECSAKDIRNAFRDLAKKHHPDKNYNEDASEIFISLYEAFTILSDAKKKIEYDRLYEDVFSENYYNDEEELDDEQDEEELDESVEKDTYSDEFDKWVKYARQKGKEFSLKPLKKVLRFILLSPFYIISKTADIIYKITFYLVVIIFIAVLILGVIARL